MRILGIDPLATTALVSLYLLGFMFFIGQGGFKRVLRHDPSAENIELIMLDGRDSGQPDESRHGAGQPDGSRRDANIRSGSPTSQANAPRGRGRRNFEGDFELTDRLSKQAQVLREQYRLSARETEVMEYIARGYTVARTAEELIVSENTIRTHSKRIYAKLDVHKKQELIDMLKAVEL